MAFFRFFTLCFLCLCCVVTVGAQDSRNVVEPRLPATCKVLNANLTPHNGTLADTIERHYRDNDRLEKAMASCAPGKAVVLRADGSGKSVFLISPMRMRAGVTLVVEASAAVWGSKDPRNYDVAPGSCGLVAEARGPGCRPLILAEDAPHSGIMGDGVIDGRGGATLIGLTETWWELAHRAKVEDASQAVSRILVVRRSNDFTLYRITLRNSPNCHVSPEQTDGFTAWGVKIDTPKWARNTDGIDPQAGSTNISIIDSYIRSGDDNISPKSTAQGAVSRMTVRNTHFYNGHGMSIGSQTSGGISAIRVDGLTIDGADNGLRIKSEKSRGGLVDDVRFENVCIRNSPNPIVLNPFSTTFEGTKIPVYKNIALRNVHALQSGSILVAGLDAAHRLEATFENVTVDGVTASDIQARHAVLNVKRGNLDLSGDDVRVTGGSGGGTAYSCDLKFPPFPENTISPVSAEIIPSADKTFYVAADGTGDYYSVQSAISRVPTTGGVVLVAPGVYRERVMITQSHVTLKSANADARKTVIVFDLSQGTQLAQAPAGSLQGGHATVRARGDDFTAENITFENDFNRTHMQEKQGSQAQALNLSGDRNVLHNVRIVGNQNTLYLGAKSCGQASGTACDAGRTYIAGSFISGNVDVIYGDGLAFFEGCEIHSTAHAAGGFLTAQGKHYTGQESEFVFHSARLTAEPGAGVVYLGRAWRDLASVTFLDAQMGPHISPTLWREWQPGQTRRRDTANFRAYSSPGLSAQPLARTLTQAEASHYTAREILAGKDNWNPTTR